MMSWNLMKVGHLWARSLVNLDYGQLCVVVADRLLALSSVTVVLEPVSNFGNELLNVTNSVPALVTCGKLSTRSFPKTFTLVSPSKQVRPVTWNDSITPCANSWLDMFVGPYLLLNPTTYIMSSPSASSSLTTKSVSVSLWLLPKKRCLCRHL